MGARHQSSLAVYPHRVCQVSATFCHRIHTMQALRTSVTVNRGQALASTARVARKQVNLVCRAKVRISLIASLDMLFVVRSALTTLWGQIWPRTNGDDGRLAVSCSIKSSVDATHMWLQQAVFRRFRLLFPRIRIIKSIMCSMTARLRRTRRRALETEISPSPCPTQQVEYEAVGTAYANALLSTAQSKGALEAVHADIDAIASVMKDSADIKEFLANPTVPEDKKKQMIAKMAAESGFNSYTVNFLNILVDQSRIDAITEVCDAFETKYCELTDTQVATLRSAVKLEQEQQFLIAKKLQELTKSKNVKIKPVVDESLIAGFVVEWGSSQIDLSVKGQLDKIGNELMATANAQ